MEKIKKTIEDIFQTGIVNENFFLKIRINDEVCKHTLIAQVESHRS